MDSPRKLCVTREAKIVIRCGEFVECSVVDSLQFDGMSCMACHRIVEDKVPFSDLFKTRITGNFTTGNPAELFGPFQDNEIVTDPMNNSLGIKPKHDPYIKSARMCGNCHTINLPLMDNPDADPNKPHLEQVTYLEWLNSGYQNEVGTNSKAQTCQDCHMPTKYSNGKGTLNIPLIQQPIAFIEDTQYPQTGNRLPDEKIQVRFRDKGFVRHQLQGLNVTLLEMFRQFMSPYKSNGTNILANAILGVEQNDYMSGLDDLSTAIDSGTTTQRIIPRIQIKTLPTKGTPIEDWKFQIATASQAATLR